jgi:hypothetical protein
LDQASRHEYRACDTLAEAEEYLVAAERERAWQVTGATKAALSGNATAGGSHASAQGRTETTQTAEVTISLPRKRARVADGAITLTASDGPEGADTSSAARESESTLKAAVAEKVEVRCKESRQRNAPSGTATLATQTKSLSCGPTVPSNPSAGSFSSWNQFGPWNEGMIRTNTLGQMALVNPYTAAFRLYTVFGS